MRIVRCLLFISVFSVFYRTFPARALPAGPKGQASKLFESGQDLIRLKMKTLIGNFLNNIENGNYRIDIDYGFPQYDLRVGLVDTVKYFLTTVIIAGSIQAMNKAQGGSTINDKRFTIGLPTLFAIAMGFSFIKQQSELLKQQERYKTLIAQIPPNDNKYLITKYTIWESLGQFHKKIMEQPEESQDLSAEQSAAFSNEPFTKLILALNNFEYQEAVHIIETHIRDINKKQPFNPLQITPFSKKESNFIDGLIDQIAMPYLSVFDVLKQNIITYFRLNEIDKTIYLIYESMVKNKQEHNLQNLQRFLGGKILEKLNDIIVHYTTSPLLAKAERVLNKVPIQTLSISDNKSLLRQSNKDLKSANDAAIEAILYGVIGLYESIKGAYRTQDLTSVSTLMSPKMIEGISRSLISDYPSPNTPLDSLYKKFFDTEMQKKLFELLLNYKNQEFLEIFDNLPISNYRDLTSQPGIMQEQRSQHFGSKSQSKKKSSEKKE
jgi:hypothetical protein